MTAPTPIPRAVPSKTKGCLFAFAGLGCFAVAVVVLLLAAIGAVSLVRR